MEEWAMKPRDQRSFHRFHRAVNAAAFSTGSRWKTVAKTVGAVSPFYDIPHHDLVTPVRYSWKFFVTLD